MNRKDVKQVLISIVVGAVVTFLATLFEELAIFLRDNSTELVAGGVSSLTYLSRNIRV